MADIGLDGLASGMGTEEIINKLVEIERKPIINMQKEKMSLEESKSAWRDVNSRLDKLGSKLTQLKLSSTFNSNSTTSSNEDVATATATSDADAGNYQIDVNQLAQTNRVASKQTADSFTLDLGGSGNTETFEIELKDAAGNNTIAGNSMSVEVTHGDTLEDIRDAINNATVDHDGDVDTDEVSIAKASVVDNRLVIESYQTGEDSELAFTDSGSGILENDLGFNLDIDGKVTGPADGTVDSTGESGVLQEAQDAEFSVNGLGITKSSNENIDDVIDEVTFSLSGTGSTTIDVSKDTEKATSAVQEFVDQYNSTMEFIDKKLNYDPETKQAGTLQGDATLMRLQSNLRRYITDQVDTTSSYNQLSMIGVEIDKKSVDGDDVNITGQMSFDSSKLKEAIEDSPDEVVKLFNADSSDSDSFDGIATRLDKYLDMLTQTNTGVIPEKVDYYDTRMDDIDDEIFSLEERLAQKEERLINEFTAMEKAISEMNSQFSQMQSQLSSMGGSSLLNSMM